ncbi:hypothetical protein [Listeria costaricensis]|uniref:hypothetical protein n=1 Tax=Listeria costaricensis TaxID=2026604 RepID=UPI000C080EFF|nr:hypothetical protein [Listeria costaricensis]
MQSNSSLVPDYFREAFPHKQLHGDMYDEEDIYYKIPKLVFRFVDNTPTEKYDQLKACIESFNGNLKWTMFQSFYGRRVRNYIITPERVYEMVADLFEKETSMGEKEYFSEEEFKFLCDNAIADIPALYEHIKNNYQF